MDDGGDSGLGGLIAGGLIAGLGGAVESDKEREERERRELLAALEGRDEILLHPPGAKQPARAKAENVHFGPPTAPYDWRPGTKELLLLPIPVAVVLAFVSRDVAAVVGVAAVVALFAYVAILIVLKGVGE